jgi:hypothetical protein
MENLIYSYEDWIKNVETGPSKKDLKLLNDKLKNNKNILLTSIKNWWVPFLPELERFEFDDKNISEAVELIKNNNVRTLRFRFGPDKKYDLSNLLVFKDTLEELYVDGNYKNIEIVINEMKKLKKTRSNFNKN